jgi:hypothetical protein
MSFINAEIMIEEEAFQYICIHLAFYQGIFTTPSASSLLKVKSFHCVH